MNVSEKLNDENGVFGGTRMPDMLDSAWLAIKTKTLKSEPTLGVNSVEPSARGCQQFVGQSQLLCG